MEVDPLELFRHVRVTREKTKMERISLIGPNRDGLDENEWSLLGLQKWAEFDGRFHLHYQRNCIPPNTVHLCKFTKIPV